MSKQPVVEIPIPPPTQPILTVNEAAAVARLHRNTIRKLIRTKELPAKRSGRRILIRRIDLDAYLEPDGEGS
ncbi:excisionase family DNA binding protein [Bradyrhizobium sp. USDA 326]|uniref:helix-turn-helix domain-containing protein n=1 Tax=unclassified Bradyrhizobium TaxID=2631580 RepID=UPI0035117E5C